MEVVTKPLTKEREGLVMKLTYRQKGKNHTHINVDSIHVRDNLGSKVELEEEKPELENGRDGSSNDWLWESNVSNHSATEVSSTFKPLQPDVDEFGYLLDSQVSHVLRLFKTGEYTQAEVNEIVGGRGSYQRLFERIKKSGFYIVSYKKGKPVVIIRKK